VISRDNFDLERLETYKTTLVCISQRTRTNLWFLPSLLQTESFPVQWQS